MATLIICPVCETRYEIKAAFPPEGRKVPCTNCSHVWQALPASAGAQAPAPPAACQVPPPQAAAPPAHLVDAEYGLHDDGVAEAAEMNADAAPPPPAPVPPGGLFTKIMGARAPEAAPPPPPQADAAFGEAG